ncbi:MAG: hypothetical protein H6565_05880 [Lewinellaceae bacterium]|nr:hypothetical protein [Lewinellaceae bacterium]
MKTIVHEAHCQALHFCISKTKGFFTFLHKQYRKYEYANESIQCNNQATAGSNFPDMRLLVRAQAQRNSSRLAAVHRQAARSLNNYRFGLPLPEPKRHHTGERSGRPQMAERWQPGTLLL